MLGSGWKALRGRSGRPGWKRSGPTILRFYSRNARSISLVLYKENNPAERVNRFALDPVLNKTGLIWHCRVLEDDLHGATLYAYRVDGPYSPSEGHRFDHYKVLLDPFAHSFFFPSNYSRLPFLFGNGD